MFKKLKKYGEFDYFSEKRLIFIRPRSAERTDSSDVEASQTPLSPEEARQRRMARLAAMKAGLPDPYKKTPPTPSSSTHTRTDIITRRATPPEPDEAETVKVVETASDALRMRGKMEAKETAEMQGVHENLYTQYMNPAFMLYLRSQGILDKVYPALDLIMQHPADFEYVPKGGEILHIVKREPKSSMSADIPDNFLVIMETTEGNISHVISGGFDSKDLKVDGKLPWMSNEVFQQNLLLYNTRWTSEWASHLYAEEYKKWDDAGRQPPDKWQTIFKNSFEPISGQIQDIHVAMNVDFPRRFVAMVNARHIPFEQQDPRVVDIVNRLIGQGENYEDITRNGYGEHGKLHISVMADPKLPGIYQIYTTNFQKQPLRVNAKGYIMRQAADGSWSEDARYDEAVRRDYYKNNPVAETADPTLTQGEKDRMKKTNDANLPTSPTTTREKQINELVVRRQKVDTQLYKDKYVVPTEKLKEIMKRLFPPERQNQYYYDYIDGLGIDPATKKIDLTLEQQVRKQLQDGIKFELDSDVPRLDGTRNDRVANDIGVTF